MDGLDPTSFFRGHRIEPVEARMMLIGMRIHDKEIHFGQTEKTVQDQASMAQVQWDGEQLHIGILLPHMIGAIVLPNLITGPCKYTFSHFNKIAIDSGFSGTSVWVEQLDTDTLNVTKRKIFEDRNDLALQVANRISGIAVGSFLQRRRTDTAV